MDQFIFDQLLDEFMFEVSIESNWTHRICQRLNLTVIEDDFQFEPNGKAVSCPICSILIGGVRFAPHLEKCLRKIGAINTQTQIPEDSFGFSRQKIHIDPYPDSLIVRIKLGKNKFPMRYQKREGVSEEDFLSAIPQPIELPLFEFPS